MRVALAQLNQTVGDLAGNVDRIVAAAQAAAAARADVLVTPAQAIAGAPAEDLLLQEAFVDACERALADLCERTAGLGLAIVVGTPLRAAGGLRDAAVVLAAGRMLGHGERTILAGDGERDDRRWFHPGSGPLITDLAGVRCAILVGADVRSAELAGAARAAGAEVLLGLDADAYDLERPAWRLAASGEAARAAGRPLALAGLVGGQDEWVHDGQSFALQADGQLAARARMFDEDLLLVDVAPGADGRVASGRLETGREFEWQVYQALVTSLRDYVAKNRVPSVLLAFSGGMDSALVLAIAVDALGSERVRTLMMPSPYTAGMSVEDARTMATRLGVRHDEIPIGPAFDVMRRSLAPLFDGRPEDTTEENLQARIRGMMMMALANKFGGIVLTTSNKSESAVGYSTLYGDMAGGFAVLRDVPKTLVYRLGRWRNRDAELIPERIITRPPSAELRPDQTDQDSLPPYEVLDRIMAMHVEEGRSVAQIVAAGYPRETVERIVGLIRFNEYKRRQGPVGPRVTRRSFGRDWQAPMTSRFRD